MPQLLVSVRNVDEAAIALSHGAAIIDVKEPARGSLGAADEPTIRRIVDFVDRRLPVSAALGEFKWLQEVPKIQGLTWYKLGLAGALRTRTPKTWHAAFTLDLGGAEPVAVAYADWKSCNAPKPVHVVEVAATRGCRMVLLDTYDKNQGGLLELWNLDELRLFMRRARSLAFRVALAGSLKLRDLPQILPLWPDLIAVRGAVCRGGRQGPLDGALVEEWARAVRHGAIGRRCEPAAIDELSACDSRTSLPLTGKRNIPA